MELQIIKADKPLRDPAVLAIRDKLRAGVVAGGAGRVDVPAAVREIITDVQARGDRAVIEWTKRLDKAELTPETLRVSADEISAAHAEADKDFLALVRRAAANIREYQKHILIQSPEPLKRAGRRLALRYTPINRAAVYVPGAKAVLASTVLMTVVPGQVAGVGEIALASPPLTDGDISPMVLALAGELGVSEVYRAAAVPLLAALAIGTEAIQPVDKIFGPGNAFVVEAKRQLFGRVGIESLPGPSEVLILADESAPPGWVAADMLAQAEHNPGSAVLVTTSEKLANSVVTAITEQLPQLERKEAIEAALKEYSAIIVVPDIAAACDVANDFAPEHLQIITADDESALAKIRNAGAIFLGPQTPVPLGDYYAGSSHVLPTGGAARFFGPLSANDFLKASSIVRYDAAALAQDADDVIAFAKREGLTAHARAVEIRKQQ
jgi:histidinol dehydrogenase